MSGPCAGDPGFDDVSGAMGRRDIDHPQYACESTRHGLPGPAATPPVN
ncbi:hypothetical protein [Planctomicrobium sp. SH664]